MEIALFFLLRQSDEMIPLMSFVTSLNAKFGCSNFAEVNFSGVLTKGSRFDFIYRSRSC